ncbi:hypothetical protein CEP51_001416 [Fusarium floridanum]|uniref:NB-ARC domain-containing protein n=1 Tax=Fusarium floridanum TaxID=1325733 RepID=A0A428SGZ4_9HYPO|nr:hypothetical protein CEP51_001416 [Fusarium floridanum]
MEYLVAIELLPHSRLRTIPLPESLTASLELSILRGLLLSRMQYHYDASRVLYEIFLDAIANWGLASFQVGIVAAESANCHNMLRKEHVANTIATRCLAARNTPELISRKDWSYLSLYLVDSLIGSGRYAEAESALERLISQPSITPAIHMMGCLRLSKIQRRLPEEDGTVESHHSLREGLSLFHQVPCALQEEYLEEMACSLSAATTTTQRIFETETLVNAVNDLLGQGGSGGSPALKRYSQSQLEFKQHILRREKGNTIPGIYDYAANQTNTRPTSLIDSMAIPVAIFKVFSVPCQDNNGFVQRPEANDIPLLPGRNENMMVYSIYGNVGVGKTTLTTYFANSLEHACRAVIWIGDSPLHEISYYLSSVATELGLADADSSKAIPPDKAREYMYKWFTNPRSVGLELPWLIVFDGIESEEALRQFWPTGGRFGTVLVVTREKPSFSFDETMGLPWNIKLGPMDPTNGMEVASEDLSSTLAIITASPPIEPSSPAQRPKNRFLQSIMPYSRPKPNPKPEYLLADFLDGHPAAIEQAASVIVRRNLSLTDFMAKYQSAQAIIDPDLAIDIMKNPNHNIHLITIWLLDTGDGWPLMNIICLLDPSSIPESILWHDTPFASLSEACLDQAIKDLEPESEDYWSIQAACHHRFGDVNRRVRSVQESVASYEMSIEALEQMKGKAEKDLLFVRVKLGFSLLMNYQPKAAEKVLKQARLQTSTTKLGDIIASSETQSIMLLGLATAKLSQSKPEESLQLGLEYLSKVLPFVGEGELTNSFHLIISGGYGHLSEFNLAL